MSDIEGKVARAAATELGSEGASTAGNHEIDEKMNQGGTASLLKIAQRFNAGTNVI